MDSIFIYDDYRTTVIVESIEELPMLNLLLHKEIVHLGKGTATDRILFLKIRVECVRLGKIYFPVICVFVENEALEICSDIPDKSSIKLTPIKNLSGISWSDHEDVTWNLVSKI